MTVNLSHITSSLVSTLGNSSSKVPLAIKDITNSLGMTYQSYQAGGKVEGKDRFIDEFGTQAIWLFGIPFFQGLINKTAYKALGYNPNIDIRVVASKNKKIVANAIKNAPTEALKQDMKKAAKNLKVFKGLFYGKFAVATALTLGAYFGLTKYKQHITQKKVEQDFYAKKEQEEKQKQQELRENIMKSAPTFAAFYGNKKSNNPSFAGGALQNFMFDPVKNMLILDAGITTERLAHSRTKGEFAEYALKEGTFLFFMYCAGKFIQDGIEKASDKLFKKPIDAHINFLTSKELKEGLKTGQASADLTAFQKLLTQDIPAPKGVIGKLGAMFGFEKQLESVDKLNIQKFVQNNPDNLVVQMLKKSDILKTLGDKVDTSQYLSERATKKAVKSMDKLIKAFNNSGEGVETFLKKTKNLKVGSVALNIGICCLAMGYILPKMIMSYRKQTSGSNEFHVAKEYEKQLAIQFEGQKLNS